MDKPNLGFLASGQGTNMQAIIDACQNGHLDARSAVVISNNEASAALKRAQNVKIPAYHISKITHPHGLDEVIVDTLRKHDVDLVILAGYMKKIGQNVLTAFKNRIINIHPSLLPKYGGQDMYGIKVHEAVLAAGESETGVTIHLVNEIYDEGLILAQQTVPVNPEDTAELLTTRVLEVEHVFYVETLQKIIDGEINLPAA
ncbi:MAG: phosphoribosylglycinamide formyltransferase [Gammaproteobacteria bacterium]